MKTKNSNSNNVELCSDHRNKNDHKGKNGSRTTNDMSQTVCLFKKYLLARAQYDNIGKTNTEESEVINKSPHRHLLPIKFSRNSLSRPPSLLERNLLPELRCDSEQSTQSRANKASGSSQFTIFYDGKVNVYDNVSAEKAQEVMLILGGESSLSKPVPKEADSRSSPPRKSDSQITSKSPYEVVASSPSNGATENNRPSLSPFPSRLGYFFPVAANKGPV
ncbi:hypothetical protein L484_018455 [Morus notabilis]|uniref:Protein TIFY n=1 Tax=Morus notabilis TaxID=981085 RepID=W9QMW2_9ROSA|nr:hypothetical protein L484_018455 [Morus notabilis]